VPVSQTNALLPAHHFVHNMNDQCDKLAMVDGRTKFTTLATVHVPWRNFGTKFQNGSTYLLGATVPYLVAWHSGRTSVSDRRTFPVLRSTCSWWVTINVGKPSAIGQPTKPTQPFILSESINEKKAGSRCVLPFTGSAIQWKLRR